MKIAFDSDEPSGAGVDMNIKHALIALCLGLIGLASCASRDSRRHTSYRSYRHGGYTAPPVYPYRAPPQQVGPPPPPLPNYVTVILRDVAIAPQKPDGRAWDCCGDVPWETADRIGGALADSLNPYAQYAAIVMVLAPLAGAGTTPPEVFGSAQLYVQAQPRERIQFNRPWQQDSYTPLFTSNSGPPTWVHVPFGPSTHIQGELWDKDLAEDDPIGPFDINYSQLKEALLRNTLYPVQVDRTILFIRLSVLAE